MIKNESGTCPICNGYSLDYDSMMVTDNMAYYPYICKTCGVEGEEWYKMDFNGHNVLNTYGDYYELGTSEFEVNIINEIRKERGVK